MNEVLSPTPPPNIDAMTNEERTGYILDVRHRVNEGENVSDDEIRDAVRMIRLGRAHQAKNKKGAKPKTPTITLADF